MHVHINQKSKVDPGLSSQTKRRFHKLDYHSLSGYPHELREDRHRMSGKNLSPSRSLAEQSSIVNENIAIILISQPVNI